MDYPFGREMTDREWELFMERPPHACMWCTVFGIPFDSTSGTSFHSVSRRREGSFWDMFRMAAGLFDDQLSAHWSMDLALRRIAQEYTGQDVPRMRVWELILDMGLGTLAELNDAIIREAEIAELAKGRG